MLSPSVSSAIVRQILYQYALVLVIYALKTETQFNSQLCLEDLQPESFISLKFLFFIIDFDSAKLRSLTGY